MIKLCVKNAHDSSGYHCAICLDLNHFYLRYFTPFQTKNGVRLFYRSQNYGNLGKYGNLLYYNLLKAPLINSMMTLDRPTNNNQQIGCLLFFRIIATFKKKII